MMDEVNQGNSSTPEFQVKRKRGRPRKDESLSRLPGSGRMKKNQTSKVHSNDGMDNALVGQIVSGVLDGSFDAGYLLTVRVSGTGNLLRGVVFDPRFSVPVTAANDVAPQVNMIRRNNIPFSVVDTRKLAPLAGHEKPPPKLHQGNIVMALASGSSQVPGNSKVTALAKAQTVGSTHVNQNLNLAKNEGHDIAEINLAQLLQADKGKESMGKLPGDLTSAAINDGSDNKTGQLLLHDGKAVPQKNRVGIPFELPDETQSTHEALTDGVAIPFELPDETQSTHEALTDVVQSNLSNCQVIHMDTNMTPEAFNQVSQIEGQTNNGGPVKVVGLELTNESNVDNLQHDKQYSTVGYRIQENVPKDDTSGNSSLVAGDHHVDGAGDSGLTSMPSLTHCLKPSVVDSVEPMPEQFEQTVKLFPEEDTDLMSSMDMNAVDEAMDLELRENVASNPAGTDLVSSMDMNAVGAVLDLEQTENVAGTVNFTKDTRRIL